MNLRPFRPEHRLLQAADFKQVFDNASYKVHQPALMLLAVPATAPRLGLIVAKRKIKFAHDRNRFKRLARESFRLHRTELPNLDIVCMAKSDALSIDNAALHQQLEMAWSQLKKRVQRNQTIVSTAKKST